MHTFLSLNITKHTNELYVCMYINKIKRKILELEDARTSKSRTPCH